ncbi:hypothetical protein [Gangjinia marincola]|uniref:hypothetical protein n=1 Tax=Gangjinia marincola TaxID=578463 RepID=UPI0031D35D9D
MSKLKELLSDSFQRFLFLLSLSLIVLFVYILYRVYQNEGNLLSITIFPLLLGVIYENRRLGVEWNTLILKSIGALILSFVAFIPGKRSGEYIFDERVEIWPYYFIVIFAIISFIRLKDKVVPNLTEGITLIQSFCILYWLIEVKVMEINNTIVYILAGTGILFSILSFIHAFTYISLSRTSRLTLSIWSSVIMFFFAADYMIYLYLTDVIYKNEMNIIISLLQYFLLGTSLIYFIQNISMFLVYLPSKHFYYTKQDKTDIKEMHNRHIKRYSKKQVKVHESFIILLICSFLFYLNLANDYLSRHSMIWIIFIIIPIILRFKRYLMQYFYTIRH